MYLQFIYESVFTELVSFKFNLLNLNLNLFWGCKPSFYGSNCEVLCPTNCNVSCHIQHGTCFTCKPGWTGETCNASMIMV